MLEVLHNSCNTGTCAMSFMFALTLRRCILLELCIHYQCMTAYVITINNISLNCFFTNETCTLQLQPALFYTFPWFTYIIEVLHLVCGYILPCLIISGELRKWVAVFWYKIANMYIMLVYRCGWTRKKWLLFTTTNTYKYWILTVQ